ncbi:MAG TPA: alkaline phosphatase D family protein [Nitrospiraceae bacterium]|nr:alkaline phosphatase D family protein [Nitrospiraceae bacterium]
MLLTHGVATGEVTSHSARVWFRTNAASAAQVEWMDGNQSFRSAMIQTGKNQDYTAMVLLDDLKPATTYRYVVRTVPSNESMDYLQASPAAEGRFVTAPSDDQTKPLTFVWSGDLGGQQRCRRTPSGYAIFDEMLRREPHFMIFLGDTIYSDDRCPSPPNVPGSEFTASMLDEYRAKHRYQREDAALQRFFAATPVYAIWDDHEVRNNFSGPIDPLMPAGRQALLEYWPIATPSDDPDRLYRKFRWGADAEVFILDTRQYRSSNGQKDGPNKTMLGSAQRTWLVDELSHSTATWKFVATSVPLSNQKGGTLLLPGNDSWARGADGTGFLTELRGIVDTLLARHISNIVWLAGDVHYAQVNDYDPDGDGATDFYEFICGPLSAAYGRPVQPNTDLKPTNIYSEGGFSNFGVVTVEGITLRLAVVDESGAPRFERTIQARALPQR